MDVRLRNGANIGGKAILPQLLHGLLLSTALLTPALCIGGATAQQIIDGGAVVSVPGTQATPWAIGDGVIVGDTGSGQLLISAGGDVGNTTATIGNATTGIGSVAITGSGSTWTSTAGLVVGNKGQGSLDIELGGKVESLWGSVSGEAGASGDVLVSGTGSSWFTTNGITVGNGGEATMTVNNGAEVKSSGGSIANYGHAGVTITSAGSSWNNSGDLVVGVQGLGTLTIADGASVGNVNGTIAENGTVTGVGSIVTVTGDGSVWTNSGELTVGLVGSAGLAVEEGGQVLALNAAIGASTGGRGAVSVDGAGSLFSVTGNLYVGSLDAAWLTITNGAHADSQYGIVGYGGDGDGTVEVSGAGSLWQNDGTLKVGEYGFGALDILDGGVVTTDTLDVGVNADSVGTVRVDGAGSRLEVAGNFIVGDAGRGELIIANGGTVSGPGVVTLGLVGSPPGIGIISIGGGEGAAATAAGTLDLGGIQFEGGVGVLSFNHTDTGYVFDTELVSGTPGDSAIVQRAGTTILTADSSGFTGVSEIYGGRLIVNGLLSGTEVRVRDGGTLGGSGTVGEILAKSGSIVAPGNSIGILTVAGNATLEAGSTFRVDVNDVGESDRLDVGGVAALAGNVQVMALAGDYALSTQYIILTAAGGIDGTFAGVTSNLAFLDPSLSYDFNNAYLTLDRNATYFADIGTTPNQRATGGAIEPLGGGNDIYDAVLPLDLPTALDAFDQLSGEIHATAQGTMIEDSRFAREAALDRLRSAFGSDGKLRDPAGVTLWSNGFASRGSLASDGNAAGLDHDASGLFLGADGALDNVQLGVFGGISRSGLAVDERNSSASVDGYHIGLYGGTKLGELAFRGGAIASWQNVTATRAIAFPGFADTLDSQYSAQTVQAFGEIAYSVELGADATLEPFVNAAYVNLTTDSFAEQGGAASLSGEASSSSVGFTTLGLRGSAAFTRDGDLNVTGHGLVGWRHAYGDTRPAATLSFDGGAPFAIAGTPIAEDTLVLEAGVAFEFSPEATLALSYTGQLSPDAVDQSVSGELSVKF